jgi:DNA-binding CsgD family transcriptional regulator/predicted DNA-binding transcriptional regulator
MAAAVIPALTRWGLSADADLVYRALVLMGPMDEHRLTRELGMTRVRVRAAVDELAATEAVTAGCGRAWSPSPPSEVVLRLRRRAGPGPHPAERWRQHLATLDGLAGAPLEELVCRHWTSRALARRRITRLVAAERYEHLAINTERVFSAESLAAAQPLDRSLVARGVRLRVLGRPSEDGDRAVPQRSVETIPDGGYRQLDEPPLKLVVVDRRVALFPADPVNFEAGYLEVDDPSMVQRLCAFFQRLWTQGTDPFRQGVAPIELTPRERALVALLSKGHTDVTAAAELNVSARTVAYAMRALMDRLGVDNRFQLALLLGATGTVSPPARADDER